MEKETNLEAMIAAQLPYLKQIALSYAKDESAAEDLLQDTIVRIWSNQEKFIIGTNFKAWSAVIMRNIFINGYRKRMARGGYIVEMDRLGAEPGVANNGYQKMEYDDVLHEVNALRDMYRRPVKLYQEGFSYQEIAEEMHLSIGTIKSRLHSARLFLKKRLTEAALMAS